jgi:predicted porin
MDGITFGAQYTGINNDLGLDDTSAWAVKLGYANDALSAYAAYSQTSDDNGLYIGNIATTSAQSKLYTEAYWNYGYIGQQDTATFAIGGTYDLGSAKLGAQYTYADCDVNGDQGDMDEFALTASTKVGPVDVDLAYVNTALNGGDRFNEILVMTKVPFEL